MRSIARHVPATLLLVALLILCTHFFRHRHDPIDEIDEAAVLFSTGYLGLFLAGDFRNPAWQGVDAVDHPPAWKYAHGLALRLAGRPLGRLEDKQRWFDDSWDENDAELRSRLKEEVPLSDLMPGRWFGLLSILGAIILFYVLVSRAMSPMASGVACLLFALHGVVKWVCVRALIDPMLLFLIMACALLSAVWLEQGPRRGRIHPPLATALGACLGVLTETKITGLIGVVGTIGAFLWLDAVGAGDERGGKENALGVNTRKRSWASLAVVLGTTALVGLGLNPSLWSNPVAFALSMAEHRTTQVGLQMALFETKGYISWSEGLRRFVHRALLMPDPAYRTIGFPLVAFAISLGAIHLARLAQIARSFSPERAALICHLGAWLLISIATYRMDWPRYTLPAIPLLVVLTSTSLLALHEALRTALNAGPHKAPRNLYPALSAAVLALGIAVFAAHPIAENEAEQRARLEWNRAFIERELKNVPLESKLQRALERGRAKF